MQSDRLEDLLRAEREVVPEPGAEDRIWAAVEHRLAHGPAPPSGADVAPGALGGATGSGVTLKVIAGLALLAAAVGVWAARDRPVPPPVVAVAAPIEAVPEVRSKVPAPAPTPAGVEAPAPALDPPVVEAPAPEPAPAPEEALEIKKKPRSKPKVEAAPPEDEPADFAAELKLIGQIRGALKRGDSAGALAGVDEHERRFGARGQLVQERLAYHVEALCLAGRVADARRVAREMLAKWPDSTHAPRVKSSCAGA
ncbi:hypothetical protein SAMN02745121_01851 [Nannocystis exedens]|uniref:Uncharacterized protein n=1 Tax=Nannocystis exedens TaxID=54 RepID=A0A1I1VQI0_9BACT|nr:hypothetical protein [Nannocystis exedens]PCC72734.1 hypothetical protein NAEX_05819 [Nannocystis exedens]SFD85069.1 hypothetical protein SAMN02745121_01851 [Nannocystis exedens]